MSKNKLSILILCTGNSARSQMAEGLLKAIVGDRFNIESAGTKPSSVRTEAIAVMSEIGIDISNNRSKSVDEFANMQFEYVLTVCDNAKETCPYFSGALHLIHRSFDDPAAVEGSPDVKLDSFRCVRDEIGKYLRDEFVPMLA